MRSDEPAQIIMSLLQLNKISFEREKAKRLKDDDLNAAANELKRAEKKNEAISLYKQNIRKEIKRVDEINNQLFDASNRNNLTESDLAEIEASLQTVTGKNLFIKGSRFTLGEKLQFTKVNFKYFFIINLEIKITLV